MSRAFCFSTKSKAQQNESDSLSPIPIEYKLQNVYKNIWFKHLRT